MSWIVEGFNLWVALGVLVALVLLRLLRVGAFVWALATFGLLWAFLEHGFTTPIPASVVKLYLGIAAAAIFTYVTSSAELRRETARPIVRLIVEPRLRWLLALLVVAFPAAAAVAAWMQLHVPLEAPGFARTVHPAPPGDITVHDERIDMITADQPFRPDALSVEDYRAHLDNGRRVYFQNCFYCHGDGMAGDGMYAYGLNPIPSNFTDSSVLPILQSSFVFWRIAKGGPGLPEEGGPWESAMPRWEQFLSVEDMWDVNLFLYDYNNYRPRAREEHH